MRPKRAKYRERAQEVEVSDDIVMVYLIDFDLLSVATK
jgi:hypothetical protein